MLNNVIFLGLNLWELSFFTIVTLLRSPEFRNEIFSDWTVISRFKNKLQQVSTIWYSESALYEGCYMKLYAKIR